MQTFLHGRDLIGDLDSQKRKSKPFWTSPGTSSASARSMNPTPICAIKCWQCCLLQQHAHPRLFRSWHGSARWARRFHRKQDHPDFHGDTAKEIGEIYGRYFDGIAIRHCDWGIGNSYLNEVARNCRVPILNMQCDVYHPFQCLADLMTIMEKKGRDLKRKKIVVSWAYAASYLKPISVPQSLIIQMPRFGMDVTLAYPKEFMLMPEIEQQAADEAKKWGTSFEIVHDMDEGMKDADIIYARAGDHY